MKRRALALSFSLLLLAAVPGASLASTFTVDQAQTGIDSTIGGSSPIYAQTFTAGLYGPLESVDIYMYGHPSTVAVSLQGVTGSPAVPDGTIMASKTLGVNGASAEWVRFDFATNPIVVPGHKYALFIYLTGSLNVMYGSAANSYAGGQALMFYSGAWHNLQSLFPTTPADFAFKTNVGLAAPTPTPVRAPTPTPTPTLAPTPTPAPATASASASVAAPDATPTGTTVAAVAGSTADPADPAAPAAPGSSSGGAGNPPIAILIGGLLLLILLGGGLFFLLKRRDRSSS